MRGKHSVEIITSPEGDKHDWVLNEVNPDGNAVEAEWAPTQDTLSFVAVSVLVQQRTGVSSQTYRNALPEMYDVPSITIELKQTRDQLCHYQTFGNNRDIEKFSLRLRCDDHPSTESSTLEWHIYKSHTNDQTLRFTAPVEPKLLRSYVEAITSKRISDISVRIEKPTGFYYRTDQKYGDPVVIKLLNEKIKAPDIELPESGRVGKVDIHLNYRMNFHNFMDDELETLDFKEDPFTVSTTFDRDVFYQKKFLHELKELSKLLRWALIALVLLAISAVLNIL